MHCSASLLSILSIYRTRNTPFSIRSALKKVFNPLDGTFGTSLPGNPLCPYYCSKDICSESIFVSERPILTLNFANVIRGFPFVAPVSFIAWSRNDLQTSQTPKSMRQKSPLLECSKTQCHCMKCHPTLLPRQRDVVFHGLRHFCTSIHPSDLSFALLILHPPTYSPTETAHQTQVGNQQHTQDFA